MKQLRRICDALPGTEIDVKWGADVCFCVGKKMYAVTDPGGTGVSLKVEPELFDLLVTRKGVTPAPYLARAKWVAIEDGAEVSDDELAALLRGSHALVAAGLTKALRAKLGIIDKVTSAARPKKKRAR